MRPRGPAHSAGSLQRPLRTTAVGATVIALAAGAHAWAGGELPHPLILAALVALTALASTVLARVPLRLPALAAVLGAGQLGLHEAFTALAPASASPSVSAALARGHHQHTGDALAALASVGHGGVVSAATHDHFSPLMLSLHVAATLACAVMIRRAEVAFAAMAGWLRPLTGVSEPRAVVPEARQPAAVPRAARRVLPWRQLAPPPLRGPPLRHAFA